MTISRPISFAAVCLALGLCLQGCGRRGPPEAPPGSGEAPVAAAPSAALPRNNEIAPIDSASVSAPKGAAAAEAAGAARRPARAFPLDPLL